MNTSDFTHNASGRVIRTPSNYWAYIPNPLPPDVSWSLSIINLLGEAERNLAKLASIIDNWQDSGIIARPIIHQEAVLSSRIEGTQASLDDILVYEAEQLSFLEPSSDVREVHNYVRALDFGLERIKSLPVSLRLIREMHKVLLEGVRGNLLTPGEFRRSQNWIRAPGSTLANAVFVPPPVDEMKSCLDSFEKFIHSPSDIPLLIRAALIHYQFEAIHPFLDGNGRIGRLLIVLLFCEWDLIPQPILYLSEYFENRRLEYYDHLLAVSQRGEWNQWLEFFLKGVSVQSIKAVQLLESLQQLRENYKLQFADIRTGRQLLKVIDIFFRRPIMSITQLSYELHIPYKSAQRYISHLEFYGIIREMTHQSRNRLFRADAILKIIEG